MLKALKECRLFRAEAAALFTHKSVSACTHTATCYVKHSLNQILTEVSRQIQGNSFQERYNSLTRYAITFLIFFCHYNTLHELPCILSSHICTVLWYCKVQAARRLAPCNALFGHEKPGTEGTRNWGFVKQGWFNSSAQMFKLNILL